MPSFQDITITIHTPFAIEGIPEIAPSSGNTAKKTPKVLNEKKKTVSVYIPVQPQSLFWLSYSVVPRTDGIFYVLKLFINRQHIVTWCCDREEQWKGKVQFGLFDTGNDAKMKGGAGMQKSVFQFGDNDWRVVGDLSRDGDEGRVVDVKIYRANMKLRVPRKMEARGQLEAGGGVSLQNAGHTKRGHPRKYYNFGLVDPQDAPHAVFRFFYRTWEEIDALNLRMGQVEKTEDASVFVEKLDESSLMDNIPASPAVHISNGPWIPPNTNAPPPMPAHYTPPMPTTPPPAIPRMPGEVNLRRLSIPPSTIFKPLIESGPLPASPTKSKRSVNRPEDVKGGLRAGQKQREGASGVFRSLMQGALNRK